MNLNDEGVNSLAKEMEADIKSIKDNAYRMSWYMRGGAPIDQLLSNTDLEDMDIMQRIVKDNIENTKNSKMPLI